MTAQATGLRETNGIMCIGESSFVKRRYPKPAGAGILRKMVIANLSPTLFYQYVGLGFMV